MKSEMDFRVEDIVKDIKPGKDWDMLDLLAAVASKVKEQEEFEMLNKNKNKKMKIKIKKRDHNAIIQESQILNKKRKKSDYVDEIEMEEEEELVLPEKKMMKKQTNHDEVSKQNKKSKKKNCSASTKVLKKKKEDNEETGPILEDFLEEISVMDNKKLIIRKKVFATDVGHQQNRFSIPINQVITKDFLKDEERIKLENIDNGIRHIDVKVIFDSSFKGCDGKMKQGELTLRRWTMNNTKLYIINGDGKWYDMAEKVGLCENMQVKLWSFRMDEDEKLCFYLQQV